VGDGRRGWNRWARSLAAAGAALLLAVTGWLFVAFPGPHLAAMLGVGPVDGVVVVAECHEAVDFEGYSDGTDCTGSYLPRGSGTAGGGIRLEKAAEEYPPGTRVEVRTAGDSAHELSGYGLGAYGAIAGVMLVTLLLPAFWLLSCARRGRRADGGLWIFGWLAGLFLLPLASLLIGLLISLLQGLSRL
jgi:hypothetical protein